MATFRRPTDHSDSTVNTSSSHTPDVTPVPKTVWHTSNSSSISKNMWCVPKNTSNQTRKDVMLDIFTAISNWGGDVISEHLTTSTYRVITTETTSGPGNQGLPLSTARNLGLSSATRVSFEIEFFNVRTSTKSYSSARKRAEPAAGNSGEPSGSPDHKFYRTSYPSPETGGRRPAHSWDQTAQEMQDAVPEPYGSMDHVIAGNLPSPIQSLINRSPPLTTNTGCTTEDRETSCSTTSKETPMSPIVVSS